MVPLLVASLLFGFDMPANPLLGELLTQGVPLPMGPTFRLPAPVMADGLDAKQQEAVLKKTAADLPFELFTSTSEAAPHVLKIDSVAAAGKRVAQTVDLYFLAYGKLERVVQDDVLNKLIGTDAKKTKEVVAVKALSAEALRKRGIELQQGTHVEERYAHLDVFLLDKIKITGITHNLRTDGPGSVVLTMRLDARFENDQEFPNRWRSYDVLTEKYSAPQTYSGLGGYAMVTRLALPEGALFFEMHVVMHEPEGWFGGPNLLRSKMPLVIQENVRNLRRRLKAP